MEEAIARRSSRPVAIWLLFGVGMLIIQVLLGGITRLTGSGLSITEWKPIIGAIPPMNNQEWTEAFEKYQRIAQYKFLNTSFTLHDFKFIFFWEWIHRLWARLIAVVFLIPFIIFLIQRRFRPEMVKPLIILFLLGLLQGLVGWIMVMSGLGDSERLYVSHYRLAIHFVLALGLICYAQWFALQLLVPKSQLAINPRLKTFTLFIIAVLTIQLVYGAFMAGLKAAPYAATWPDINGRFFPANGSKLSAFRNLFDDPLIVHFIHRSLAYILTISIVVWFIQSTQVGDSSLFKKLRWLPLVIVCCQLILGILTTLYSPNAKALLWLGVSHQFVAMSLLLSLVFQQYLLRSKKKLIGASSPDAT